MRNGVVFNTRRNRMDFSIIDEIWAFRKYDCFGFKVARGDVVVDIGANIGIFALYAATEGQAARVIAFEPDPSNFALLAQNVRENSRADIVCREAAVAGGSGKARLAVDPANTGGHHLTGASNVGTLEVACTTLDELVIEHELETIDYLKLDCEGSEYEILATASEATMDKIGRISMEHHPVDGHAPSELGQILSRHGFAVRYDERDRLYAERVAS